MATKKSAAGFEFLVAALKAKKDAVYADLKAKADEKGVTVYPVMFGRAKALLGLVKSAKRGQGKVAKAKAAKSAARGRSAEGSSKSGQVRALLRTGLSAAEIAKKVGCTVGLVYNVKSTSGATKKRGPGRPPRTTSSPTAASLDSIVAMVKASSVEAERLRRAVAQIRAVLDSVAG